VPPDLVNHPRYRVLKLLGQGGMGAVYLAEHLVMGRRVALKTIHARFLTNPEAVGRFRREVKAAARLAHTNVVAAYDADQAGNTHFLVMEYVEGTSLAAFAARKGPLSVEQVCAIGVQAALGLQHAHEQGLVHRDIKPANLMLTRKGQVKILDFGLACFSEPQDPSTDPALTATGMILGTADFISPEQTRSSRTIDIRADIYSLGCTLYYLLAGRVPFPEGTVVEKFIHHAFNAPPPLASLRPGLPAEVVAIVETMMAKQPADRYQTPAEVCRVLRPFAGTGRAPAAASSDAAAKGRAEVAPTEALTANTSSPPKTAPGRRKKIVVAAAAGGLALALVLGLFLILRRGPTDGPGETEKGAAPGRGVAWTGQGPTHTLVAPEHTIRGGILDFRELAGVSPQEFRDWQAGLERDGFRVSFLSNRNGVGPPLFNAIAVRERAPVTVRVFTDLTDDEAGKVGDRLKAEGLELSYVGHAGYHEAGQYRHSLLWAPNGGWNWNFDLEAMRKHIEGEERTNHRRPCGLDEITAGDERWYYAFTTYDEETAWQAFFTLTPDELLAKVEEYRDRGWRPDVLAPHWDSERFRFMLVVRDNRETVDWRVQIDMSLQDYKKVSAEEKEKGRFPLLLTSYGDETAVKYAALWVRYRILE
jgi:tRNA A-37 threonylcarbamoyl transferase component Bud32